jgi:alpha-tubulin suppressor-like RCC1 family protein
MIPLLILMCASCDMPGGGGTPSGPALTANGQALLGWGGNTVGQIGDGSNSQRLNPSLVSLTEIAAIAAGGNYTLALTADGRVLEWGGGKTTPTEVAGLTSVRQIAVGSRHRLALKQDGTVWSWGENDRGQLGDGTNNTRPSPVQVVGLTNIVSIAAGEQHSLAIRSDFSVVAWGANESSQLGDSTIQDRLTPVAVAGVTAIEIAASAVHTVVLTTDSKVMGWGANDECQLGQDPRSDPFADIECSEHRQPTVIWESATSPFPSSQGGAIAANNYMTLVVFSDGTVRAFGGYGDLIDFRGLCNPDVAALGSAVLQPLSAVVEVTAGTSHALFRTASGEVWNLGANLAGQGGSGATSIQECPQVIASTRVRGVSQVAAGEEHSLALIKGILTVAPSTVNFGNQVVSTSSTPPTEITITNSGLAPLTFREITISSSGDFTSTDTCPDGPAVLAAGASCTASVTFTPTATGPRSGSLILGHNGVGGQQEIPLSGTGT